MYLPFVEWAFVVLIILCFVTEKKYIVVLDEPLSQ